MIESQKEMQVKIYNLVADAVQTRWGSSDAYQCRFSMGKVLKFIAKFLSDNKIDDNDISSICMIGHIDQPKMIEVLRYAVGSDARRLNFIRIADEAWHYEDKKRKVVEGELKNA